MCQGLSIAIEILELHERLGLLWANTRTRERQIDKDALRFS